MSAVRLSELLIGLSGVADVGMGPPVGGASQTCLAGVGLARALGLDDAAVSAVFYASLLQHVGCTAYSHEASLLFGDEISIKRASVVTDFDRPREVLLGYLPRVVREAPSGERVKTARNVLLRSGSLVEGYTRANCEVAAAVARRLGLPAAVGDGLLDTFEAWNGSGHPRALSGDAISLVARVVTVAACAALFHRLGGPDAAVRAVRQRSARAFDPAVVDALCRHARSVFAALTDAAAADPPVTVEPVPIWVDDAALGTVLRTFGEAVDLKAPFLHGHSTEVARVAATAATRLRLGAAEIRDVELAGYVYDIGRAAVPSAIWEAGGPLGAAAWSQVRLHAYQSEQILRRSPPLAGIGSIAGLHHERLDGSGYHRSALAGQLPTTARLLAVADVWVAMTSDRPYRLALSPSRSAAELAAMVGRGELDADCVHAVVDAAGLRAPKRPRRSTALTARQIEVLRLVAVGLSNPAIARRLGISTRTAEHHVQDVYTRIGVSSRAAAALYAMQHGLLDRTPLRG